MDSPDNYLAKADGSALQSLVDCLGAEWLDNKEGNALLIAVMDGADLYASRHGELLSSRKEYLHYRVCKRMVASKGGRLVEPDRVNLRFRDAALASFDGSDAICQALAAGLGIFRYLSDWNEEHGLGWEEQVHSRVGISRLSWPITLSLVQQAERKEIILPEMEWSMLSVRERQLLTAAASIRDAVPLATWNSMSQPDWHNSVDDVPSVKIEVGRAARLCLEMLSSRGEFESISREDRCTRVESGVHVA